MNDIGTQRLVESLQYFNILIILASLILLSKIVSIKRYRHFWLWSVPIYLLLLNSLCFRVVYLFDVIVGFMNSPLYALWSEIVHAQDKLTILIYCVALLLQDWKIDMTETEKRNALLSWREHKDE